MQNKDILYARWLNGEITPEELKVLQEEGSLQDLDHVIKTVDGWSMPKYDTTAGYEKLKASRTPAKAKVRRLDWRQVTAIAASFLVLVTVGISYFNDGSETVMAHNGSTETTNLIDGTSIVVNDGSSVTYDMDNWDQSRTVELSGEGFFEVEKGAPFVVNTDNGSITVLGTKFNIRAWGDKLYVECYEGSVQVVANGQKSILTKDESVNIVHGTMNAKQKIAHQGPMWMSNTSRFYDEDILNVFQELERQYNITVTAIPLDRSFSGNFMHDDLNKALQSICKPLGLKYQIAADQKTVLIE